MSPKYTIIAGSLFFATIMIFWGFVQVYTVPDSALTFDADILVRAPGQPERIFPLEWYLSSENRPDFLPGRYDMTLRLGISPERLKEASTYCLVLPYIGGNAVRAVLNGVTLGSQGDLESGRSNIWNSVKVFSIPRGLLKEENALALENYGIYDAGLIRSPYVLDRQENEFRLFSLFFLSEASIWMLIGGIFILGLVVLSIGVSSGSVLNAKVLLGLAALCTAVFLTDFSTIPSLPVSLLSFKRCNALLRHVAVALFSFGYLRLLDRKTDWFVRVFVTIQAVCAVILLFPRTVITLKNVYTYSYLTVLPFLFYIAALVSRARVAGRGRLLLLYGVAVGVFCSAHDILASFLWPNAVLISHYGFVVMTITTLAFLVGDILRNYRQLMLEKSRVKLYREASMHDPLTQVFNRNVLPLIRRELSGTFAALILDLDDFKSINDNYGHYAGDLVLLNVVSILNTVLRKGDYIIRTGGDEFLAILPDCPPERVDSIVQTLLTTVRATRIDLSGTELGGNTASEGTKGKRIEYSASIGSAHYSASRNPTEEEFVELVNQADRRLYQEKKKHIS